MHCSQVTAFPTRDILYKQLGNLHILTRVPAFRSSPCTDNPALLDKLQQDLTALCTQILVTPMKWQSSMGLVNFLTLLDDLGCLKTCTPCTSDSLSTGITPSPQLFCQSGKFGVQRIAQSLVKHSLATSRNTSVKSAPDLHVYLCMDSLMERWDRRSVGKTFRASGEYLRDPFTSITWKMSAVQLALHQYKSEIQSCTVLFYATTPPYM